MCVMCDVRAIDGVDQHSVDHFSATATGAAERGARERGAFARELCQEHVADTSRMCLVGERAPGSAGDHDGAVCRVDCHRFQMLILRRAELIDHRD